jgi:hypothetical protein
VTAVRRSVTAAGRGLWLGLGLTAGCAGGQRPDPSIPDGPSGCPLLSTVEVSGATGLTALVPRTELVADREIQQFEGDVEPAAPREAPVGLARTLLSRV